MKDYVFSLFGGFGGALNLTTNSTQEPNTYNDCKLYASDILLNKKDNTFYPFASIGETLAIIYQTKDTMQGFCDRICTLIRNGADMPYQPTMRTRAKGDVLTITCNSAIVTFSLLHMDSTTPDDANSAQTKEECSTQRPCFADVLKQTRTILQNNPNVRFVVFDDLSIYTNDCELWEFQTRLNEISHETNTLVLSGYCIPQDDESLQAFAGYLTAYERNICYLINDAYNDANFFWFVYGYPDYKRLVFALDEHGAVIIPQIDTQECAPVSLSKLLIMEHLCKKFAHTEVAQQTLIHLLQGALNNAYPAKTIANLINLAVEHGILRMSGERIKTKYVYANSANNGKSYKNNIAIQCTVYDTPKRGGRKHLKPFIKFGETKLIISEIADQIVCGIIKAIVSGKKLGFKVKTTHKNILVALIADDEQQAHTLTDRINALAEKYDFCANIDIVCIPTQATETFLNTYKDLYDKFTPDFFFIWNIENLHGKEITVEYPLPYIKELAIYAKRKGFALISHACKDWRHFDCFDPYQYPELMDEEIMCWCEEELPTLYDFVSKCGKYYAFMRYLTASNGVLFEASSATQKKIYLDNSFKECCGKYGVKRHELTDWYGKPITDSQLKEAMRLKIAYKFGDSICYLPEHKR